jgi:DNA polymerase V
MTDGLVMDLVDKRLVTDQIVLALGYDIEGLTQEYQGEVQTDWYGRKMPKMAHGSENIGQMTSSTKRIMEAVLRLYDRIVDRKLPVRRMYVAANHITDAALTGAEPSFEQLDLFADPDAEKEKREKEAAAREKEERLQQAMLSIKKRYGKNAILHGTSYEEGATGRDRNRQIGGHKA